MSLRRVTLELLQVHTRKGKRNSKGSLEKPNEHKKHVKWPFQKTVTVIKVKNGSSGRGWTIWPNVGAKTNSKRIVNMFMNCIMKMIGHYDANKTRKVQCKKGSCFWIELQSWTWITKCNLRLDPNLVQETTGLEQYELEKKPEGSTEIRTMLTKQEIWLMRSNKLAENWNTEDGVNLKGGRM